MPFFVVQLKATSMIPNALKQSSRWVLWRRTPDGRKVPCSVHTGKPGQTHAPEFWASYGAAVARYADELEAFAGLGFVLGDGFCGVDIDNCRDPKTGEIQPAAQSIIDECGSYFEVSPSGTGVKIYCTGDVPKGYKRQGLEVYGAGRFFAVTEQGEARELRPIPERLLIVPETADGASADRLPPQFEACREAVLALPPCIDGQNAHGALLRACCEILRYGVIGKPAWKIINEFNRIRCFHADGTTPYPWAKSELKHKWESAVEKTGAEVGKRLHESLPSPTVDEFSAVDVPSDTPAVSKCGPLTDAYNAEQLASRNADGIRYVCAWRQWIVFNGKCWEVDLTGRIYRLALKTIRAMRREAAQLTDKKARKARWTHTEKSEARARLDAMVSLGQKILPIPISHDELNRDARLLNCSNGTLDLRTGELREHRRDDFITKMIPFDYPTSDTAPTRWLQFLNEIFAGDAELIGFVRRLLGHSLVGEVLEHVFPVFYGDGANGKSTLFGVVADVLCDYALTLNQEYLMRTVNQKQHSTEVMDLYQVRLAIAAETEEGARLNETRVKHQTGGSKIRGRRLYQESWEFAPSHTLILETNHKPRIIGTDHGIWRRVLLVPFTVVIPKEKQDPELPNKLRAEAPAILRWLVQACLEWQRDGLNPPASVIAATDKYREESDLFGQFVAECCIEGPTKRVHSSELYERYVAWARARNEYPLAQKRFNERLEVKYRKGRDVPGRVIYQGIALRYEDGFIELETTQCQAP